MKAILLIDVPDNTEFDKDYRLTGLLLANEYAENVGIEFKNARLKPMPQKKEDLNLDDWVTGFNDCLDEILEVEE